ncbi:MAG: chorismate synthase [Kiritimatiellia bacterium]|nr:chorismate synthase [Lentisphaerota bacterium]
MGNIFGNRFTVTTFGESHGAAIGAVVDNCPARLPLSADDIQPQLDRRRPGQSDLTTPRRESDLVELLSGVENGLTLGGPIALLLRNTDQRPRDYSQPVAAPRPSHADFTYQAKYGIMAASGGGRASARETAARVAAGAVAEKFLAHCHKTRIIAWVSAVGDVSGPDLTEQALTRREVDAQAVRCPDPDTARRMQEAIRQAAGNGDSVGGIITCVCRDVPAGWGDPVFDKLSALLAHGMFSIPAVKGLEIGAGFAATRLRGSQHNDRFISRDGRLRTATNRSGGIQGGISNGEPIILRVAFKPTATIACPQQTAAYDGTEITLAPGGRHDPCVLPRAVPVVEAMAALALADAALSHVAPCPDLPTQK